MRYVVWTCLNMLGRIWFLSAFPVIFRSSECQEVGIMTSVRKLSAISFSHHDILLLQALIFLAYDQCHQNLPDDSEGLCYIILHCSMLVQRIQVWMAVIRRWSTGYGILVRFWERSNGDPQIELRSLLLHHENAATPRHDDATTRHDSTQHNTTNALAKPSLAIVNGLA